MTADPQTIEPEIAGQFNRLPPCDITAEQCLIASIILDPNVLDHISELIHRDAFYQADHQVIFDVLARLHANGSAVDAVILRDELVKRNLLGEVGGAAYIGKLLDTVPSAANAAHYAKIVREKYVLRQIISSSNDALRDAYAPHENADAIASRHAERLAKVAAGGRVSGVLRVGEQIEKEYFSIGEKDQPLLQTGIRDLDEEIGGIGLGEMIVIGSFPSMGKSTLGRQMVLSASRMGTPTALISLEEGRRKLARNWLSAEAMIDNKLIRRRQLSADDYKRLLAATATTADLPAYFTDEAFDLKSIRAWMTRAVAKHGVKIVVIDYLQKIRGEGRTRFEQVTSVSLELARMLKELSVAGIIMAQLNRDAMRRDDRRPMMGDLRESGQIEQDADGIMFLHREDYWHIDDTNYQPTRIAELLIAKWRDGERGKTVRLHSNLRCQRFDDIEPGLDFGGSTL